MSAKVIEFRKKRWRAQQGERGPLKDLEDFLEMERIAETCKALALEMEAFAEACNNFGLALTDFLDPNEPERGR